MPGDFYLIRLRTLWSGSVRKLVVVTYAACQ